MRKRERRSGGREGGRGGHESGAGRGQETARTRARNNRQDVNTQEPCNFYSASFTLCRVSFTLFLACPPPCFSYVSLSVSIPHPICVSFAVSSSLFLVCPSPCILCVLSPISYVSFMLYQVSTLYLAPLTLNHASLTLNYALFTLNHPKLCPFKLKTP